MTTPAGDRGRAADFRLRTYPLAVIGSILAAVIVVVATSGGADSLAGRLGGDFPQFYGAGTIILDGDADRLYDLDRQLEAQAPFLDDGGILFAYPAAFAVPYVALASVDYRLAYLVHTLAMMGLLAAAFMVARDLVPVLADRRHRLAAFAFALSFPPMFIGVTLGQNTALTLLAGVGVWWCLDRRRDVVAGLITGLMFVKPQYAVVIAGLLVVARRWSSVAAAVVAAVGVWLVSAAVAGLGWTTEWIDLVRSLSETDGGTNLHNEVSWLGLAEVALGSGSPTALALALVASAATVGVLLWRISCRPVLDAHTVALVPPVMLLVAPHALYYDAGLLLVSLGVLLVTVGEGRRGIVAAVWWAAGLGHVAASSLGVEPVAMLVFVTAAWALWSHHRVTEAERGAPSVTAPLR
ncbi:MAG: glycosyltransferase family 87 protein [Acidimicrobiales bacterium]